MTEIALQMVEWGWTHYTRAKNTPISYQEEWWMASPHVDPIKLTIKRLWESPVSCAQATLPLSHEDHKWLLAIQDRMHPINLVINITKAPNLQVIHFDTCLALPCGD
jgi:hypothetical protein